MSQVGTAPFSQHFFTAMEYVQKYGTNQEKRTLMQRHSYPKNFYFMLEELGLVRPSNGEATIWHLEDDWIMENVTFGSIVTASTGAGSNVTVKLAAGSMLSKNGVNISYPQVRQEIEIPITGEKVVIVAKDQSVTPHNLTLKPVDPTVNLAGKIVADKVYALTGNAWAEGTYGADPRVGLENRWENYYQIFKQNWSATGTSLTLDAPYKVAGADGNVFVTRNTQNTEKRHREDISTTLLVGKKSNTEVALSDHLGHNVPVYRTGGAFTEALAHGFKYEYENQTFGLDEFDDVAAYTERERIATDMYLFLMGNTLEGYIENVLMAFGASQNGVFNYAKDKFAGVAGSDPEDFFTWIGFRGLHKKGKNFLFKSLTDFNNPKILGSAGYQYPASGLIVPYATMSNKGKKLDTPSLGAEYRSLGGYDRKFEIVKTGGADMVNPTTDLDAKSWDFRSEIGGDWALLGQWIPVVPKAV